MQVLIFKRQIINLASKRRYLILHILVDLRTLNTLPYTAPFCLLLLPLAGTPGKSVMIFLFLNLQLFSYFLKLLCELLRLFRFRALLVQLASQGVIFMFQIIDLLLKEQVSFSLRRYLILVIILRQLQLIP